MSILFYSKHVLATFEKWRMRWQKERHEGFACCLLLKREKVCRLWYVFFKQHPCEEKTCSKQYNGQNSCQSSWWASVIPNQNVHLTTSPNGASVEASYSMRRWLVNWLVGRLVDWLRYLSWVSCFVLLGWFGLFDWLIWLLCLFYFFAQWRLNNSG